MTPRRHQVAASARCSWRWPPPLTPLPGRPASGGQRGRRRAGGRGPRAVRDRLLELPRPGRPGRRRPRRQRLRGPSLEKAGEAGLLLPVDRADAAGQQRGAAQRKEPAYDHEEIEALVAYVGTLGDGPAIPDVDPAEADLAAGGEIYRANCQACHSASGRAAPSATAGPRPGLSDATPTEVGAAVRIGPGQMPVFGPEHLRRRARRPGRLRRVPALARGPRRHPDRAHRADPRGVRGLAHRHGPGLLALVAWIGTRCPIRRRERPDDTDRPPRPVTTDGTDPAHEGTTRPRRSPGGASGSSCGPPPASSCRCGRRRAGRRLLGGRPAPGRGRPAGAGARRHRRRHRAVGQALHARRRGRGGAPRHGLHRGGRRRLHRRLQAGESTLRSRRILVATPAGPARRWAWPCCSPSARSAPGPAGA